MSKDDKNERLTRIAIVSDDKCKPKKCRQECKRSCPVVRMGTRLARPAPACRSLAAPQASSASR